MPATLALVQRIDALLPQTQCTQCGYAGCRPYAQAIADGQAPINRCPPGDQAGVAALAELLGTPELPLDRTCGTPGPLRLAHIEAQHCIGCTLCIQACPVDAIVGANKRMHTVLDDLCSGCDLCVPVCPVDCIVMLPAGRPWRAADAAAARTRHVRRNAREQRLADEHDARLARGGAAAGPSASAPPATTSPAAAHPVQADDLAQANDPRQADAPTQADDPTQAAHPPQAANAAPTLAADPESRKRAAVAEALARARARRQNVGRP